MNPGPIDATAHERSVSTSRKTTRMRRRYLRPAAPGATRTEGHTGGMRRAGEFSRMRLRYGI
jgi:hypothetical protein